MIRYLKYRQIDKVKWDKCIEHSINGIVYACSWYLDIVSKHWEALVKDDYVSVFPLTTGRKFGIKYLYQPFFTQQLGIFSKNIITHEIVDEFLTSIPSKYKFAEINLNIFNKVDTKKYDTITKFNYELSLNDSYESIYKNYSQNIKRNIKKAVKSGVTIKTDIQPENIIKIFRENRGRDIKTLQDKDYLVLERLIKTCLKKGEAEIWGVNTKEGELCVGVFFIRSYKRFIFLFSGTNKQARENGAMSLLIDTFIREHSQRDLIFDFEGSNDVNLARFYKSFGSKKRIYFQLNINKLPWIIDKGVNFIKWLRRIRY